MDKMHIRLGLGLFAGCLASTAVVAAPANIIPYFELGGEYDDNLFRLADGDEAQEVEGIDDSGVFAGRATAGLAVAWPISRQRFVFSAEGSEFRYTDFDQLNHSETGLGAAWEFQAGSAFYGTADVVRSRQLSNFANRESTEADFITELTPEIEAFLEITPRWRLRSQVGFLNLEHSLGTQERFDREQTDGLLEIQYAGVPGSTLGVGVEYIDGEYPERDLDDPLPASFEQYTAFGSIDYQFSGVSRFFGRAGFTNRDASGTEGNRDFSEPTGTLGYWRAVSAKTQLTFQVYRNIFSVDNVDAIAVQDTGVSAALDWDVSDRVDITGEIEYGEQDYEALAGADSLGRQDETGRLSAELVWWPRRLFGVVFQVGAVQRDSNQPEEEYDAYFGGIAFRLELDSDRAIGEPLPTVQNRLPTVTAN